MSPEEFTLSSEDTRKLFRPPSRAQLCRQYIWATAKESGKSIVLADLVRDHRDQFARSEIYRAAHALVTHGLLTREDISWAELVKGKERTRYRYAVKYVEPFTSASRHW